MPSLFAAAKFRNVILGQILYGLDDVSGKKWIPRLKGRFRVSQEEIFWLAVEACIKLYHA